MRTLRVNTWQRRLGLLAVVGAVVAPAFVALNLLSSPRTLTLAVGVHALRALCAGVCAISAWQTSGRLAGRERRAWRLISATVALFGVGTVVYTTAAVLHRDSTYTFLPGEAFYLLAVPTAIGAFVSFPQDTAATLSRARRTLDALTVASSALFVSWDVCLRTVLVHHGSPHSGWIAIVYPLGDFVLCTLAVIVAARAPHQRRTSLLVLAAAMFSFAASDSTNAALTSLGSFHVGSWVEAGWLLGLLLAATAAAMYDVERDRSPAREERSYAWRTALLPYALVGPAAATFIADLLRRRFPDVTGIAVGAGVLVLVISRQLLTIRENLRLVEQLTGREAELREQALHDVLTGLANRRLFREHLEQALERQVADEVAVVFVDLDDFKVVNDTMGHATGDELLRKVANRLQACVRGSDVAARLGGDEFAVLLNHGGLSAAQAVAGRLTRAMRQPILCGGQPLFIQASIGIAAGSDEYGRSGQQLLEQADMAMYAAKDAGKARLAVFEPSMRERLLDRAVVKDDLARALGRGQLHLHYQPIVDLASGRVVGAEALLRWQHPQRGFIPPLLFIPLAEETGLIAPIGRWVLQQACREAAQWQAYASGGYQINVNVSAGQLLNTDIVDEVRGVLADTGLRPELLTVEITESVLMADNDTVAAQLADLKTLGIQLAIDDFGTGYSGLSYLDRLPVDILKVDKAFVDRLGEPSDRPPLAGAIVGLADLLGLDVVAEGIETIEQRSALVEMGCRRGQGYHFSRPVEADAIRALLSRSPAVLSTPIVAGVLPQRHPSVQVRSLGA